METQNELTLTVRVDTSSARREIDELKRYAHEALEQIRAAYASLGPLAPVGAALPAAGMDPSSPGTFDKRRV